MNNRLCANYHAIFFLSVLIAIGCQDSPTDNAPPIPLQGKAAFYSVDHYSESQDPFQDLSKTIQRAETEDKRILLQVGGDWCSWCVRISKYMESNQEIRQMLEQNFLVMKVTYPSDNSEAFLAQYPKIEGYPHFFVLEQDGNLLHSQRTAKLEEDESYSEDAFAEFLSSWRK
ncbi:MAG TPA: thiol-disulfide isomerase [Planctomycetaceae bacterium]|nr:thiol-disulfide isomerase [Planctomycetaceae bacterium]